MPDFTWPDVLFYFGTVVALFVFLVSLALARAAGDADRRIAEDRQFQDWEWPTWDDRDA